MQVTWNGTSKVKAEELAGILAEHSLFADCDEAELADLILRGHFVEYAKGDELIMQGDPGNSLLILLSGNARTSMIASNGHEIVLDYAEPGQVLGEIALLDGGERTASVTAIEPITALTITRIAFEEILKNHKNMALRLLKVMANRIRTANTMIEGDRAYTSGPRLARYLLRLSVVGAEEGRLKLDLSQSELGNFAGMSREHINRQLSTWSEDGIVSVESGKVRILNHATLSNIANADS